MLCVRMFVPEDITERVVCFMNSKTQKLEPAVKPLPESRIGPIGNGREAEQVQPKTAMETRLLLPMILATEARRHGIRELNSPLSE